MKVLLAACDTFRPAAIEQLKVLGEGIGVPVYTEDGVKDPISIARNAIARAKAEGYSVVIIDTAGRLAVDQELMDEISALHDAVRPTESLFVVDAMTDRMLSRRRRHSTKDWTSTESSSPRWTATPEAVRLFQSST